MLGEPNFNTTIKIMTDSRSKAVSSTDKDEIDLGQLFGTLLDGKWVIVIVTCLFMLIGVAYALLATPIYQSDALIQVEQKSSGGFSSVVSENLGDMFSSESTADTEIELIRSRMVLGGTVDKFNLTTVVKPNYIPVIGKGWARLTDDEQKIKVTQFDIADSYQHEPHEYHIQVINGKQGTYQLVDDNAQVLLKGRVGATSAGHGFVLKVSDIQADDGFEFSIVKRNRIDAVQWLKTHLSAEEQGKQTGIIRLSFTSDNADFSEALLDNISQRYFLQNVERDSAEAEQSIHFLKEKLPQLKAKLIESENKLNDYRKKRESVDLTMEAESTLKVMVNLDAQLNQLTFKEAEISQKYTKDHPAYKSLLDKRQTLLGEKAKLNKKIENLPETQKRILSLQRDVQVNQQIYVQLLNKVEELNVVKAGTVGNVRIIDHAQTFSDPVKPKKLLVVLICTILGGLMSVAYVLLRAAMHKGIETPDQIEELGLSVYASVPKSELQMNLAEKLKRLRSNTKEMNLLAELNPADLSIEALRGLRTSLHFAMMEANNNILMISGPAPGIGKSFVSTNFAAVYAKTGQRVLLIDADMRKGYLQQALGLSNDNGLSDYLSGKIETEVLVKNTAIENLDVITRGQVPPNPSELLMHKRLDELLGWASGQYDLVIVDTPPVLAVTDASIVGAKAGTTLMVTRFGVNTAKEIEVARARFEQSGIEVKGVIFNAIEKKASSHYGYGYYNYSY
ncbi:Putative tyrosine-protein kinase in cps region [Vibrio palustris]|uniref:Putative tyrosine-protein kinase in cps region n=2 Tax=Vibrio palustris TaxID=1918946 RepID=A0A1R4B3P6_9VIBR|nr:Putative tyrosine-protein kinase in cps region [Vibrio palustris]